jgi:hypothetical protein
MRLSADCAVDYVKLSDDLKPAYDIVEDSYSKDISATGIKFMAPEKVRVGSFLELHIKIPPENKFITAIGKIVRCEPEGKKKFAIAITFIWISEKDRDLVNEYVKNKRLDELRSEMKK